MPHRSRLLTAIDFLIRFAPVVLILGPSARAAGAVQHQFDIPAGEAVATLKLAAQQGGVEIMFPADVVKGIQTHEARGAMSIGEALDRMLARTGLIVVQDEKTDVIAVRLKDPPEIAEKKVSGRPGDAAAVLPVNGVPAASAQPANTPAGSAGVVVMSPFVVNTSRDQGYFASSTLSGTRLSSKIEDLGSSISVVTKEQLNDTAAVDINDIFKYEASTEGTAQFTSVTYDRTFINDDVANSPQNANRIRGLSPANVALDGYSTSNAVPLDSYNVESVEISRGPNSTIFGLGNASGTVNLIPVQAQLDRDLSRFTLRGDSYGGYRASYDLNRVLDEGKVAFRVLGLHDTGGFIRKPSLDHTDRYQFNVTLHPFSGTIIRGSWEHYDENYSRPNTNTPRDEVSYWRAAGSPTWNPVTMTASVGGIAQTKPIPYTVENAGGLPSGLVSLANGNRPFAFIDGGGVQLLTVEHESSTAIPGGGTNANVRYVNSGYVPQDLATYPAINNKSVYDWTKINYAAPNWGQLHARTYTVELEQTILDTGRQLLAVRTGLYQQESENFTRIYIGNSDAAAPVLLIDPNQYLLDGRPNPYFLHPMITGSAPRAKTYPEKNFTHQAIVAYQLDLTKEPSWMRWLGRHRLTGYAELHQIINAPAGILYRDMVADDHAWIATGAARVNTTDYQLYPRFYMGGASGNISYAPTMPHQINGNLPYYWYNGATQQWITENVNFQQVYAGNQKQKRQIRTDGLAVQDFFLNDRIVTTLGIREDRNRIYPGPSAPGAVQDPDTKYYTNITALDAFDANNWSEQRGLTRTKGIVLKVTPWLDLAYNDATSFVPATLAYNLYGQVLPDPNGRGRDYGITLKFFDDKLIFRANRYETFEQNTRSGQGANAIRANQMDFSTNSSLPDLFNDATNWYLTQNPGFSLAQAQAAASTYVGFSPQIASVIESVKTSLIDDVNNDSSKGYEFEVNYNPTRFWTLKATASRQKTVNTNLSADVQQYINERLPFWMSTKDLLTGNLWWNEPYDSANDTPQSYFTNQVNPNVQLAAALQGKPRPQERQWHSAFLTNYRLAGITNNPFFRNMNVGGVLRYESRAAIGFLGGPAQPPDNQPHTFDPNKPIYDKGRYYLDLDAGYNFKLYQGRVLTRVQLNVVNVQESGRLQATGINPDGTVSNYRIIDPRKFILTVTFSM